MSRELETSGARARIPLSSAEHTIAIVGTGFCGTVLARELLRRAQDRPLRVLLVGRAPPGRGVAYARHRHPYLLNVPAGRMSASTADPEEFVRFARTVRPQATGDDYLPRALYGDYLEATLAHAAAVRAAGPARVRPRGRDRPGWNAPQFTCAAAPGRWRTAAGR